MRKITIAATDAFWNNLDFKLGNTQVQHWGIPSMFLHDNHIASIEDNLLIISSCGWKTNTTKERLNGILSKVGAKISQVKGVWFVDCKKGNTRMFHDGMTFKL